jgi:dienelactone hydrolase
MKLRAVASGFSIVFLLLCSAVSLVGGVPVSPNQPGPYHIGSYKVLYVGIPYGVYQAVIRYPATSNGLRTPVNASAAPYPCIVVANGLLGSEWQITWIPEHLTSYGYVTLCFTPPHRLSFNTTQWATGFLAGFRALQRENERGCSPVFQMLDPETCGAIGLSMGGGGCVEATGAAGSVIDASVALAPAGSPSVLKAARNIRVPIQLQVGTVDRLVPPVSVLNLYSGSMSNLTTKEYLEITGANHVGFIDEYFASMAQRWHIDNPPSISVEQQHNISRKYFTAWFQYHLRGLDEYYTYIFGEDAQQDLQSGVLTDFHYNIP